MTKAKLTDQCLWLAHIDAGPLKVALSSLHAGSIIALSIDGTHVDFERMATGGDGRITNGFKPVGAGSAYWRSRYDAEKQFDIEVEFLGKPES